MKNLLATLFSFLLAFAPSSVVWAGPQGVDVRHGDVRLEQNGSEWIFHAPDGSIINYSSFDIAFNELVQFIQPGEQARVLNRIISEMPTQIDGQLLANGQVYIVNPAGVFFGADAKVDVAGLTAAGGSLTDEDFLAGVDQFSQVTGDVQNMGELQADLVQLVGKHVSNHGQILAENGLVMLAAGDDVFIQRDGENIVIRITNTVQDPEGTGVEQRGSIDARGGKAFLGAGDLYSLAVHHSGTTVAKNVTVEANGAVQVSGEIDASNSTAGKAGGEITILGEGVTMGDTEVDASGDTGHGSLTIQADTDGNAEGDFTMGANDTLRARGTDVEITGVDVEVGTIDTSGENAEAGSGDAIGTAAGDITITATSPDTIRLRGDLIAEGGAGEPASEGEDPLRAARGDLTLNGNLRLNEGSHRVVGDDVSFGGTITASSATNTGLVVEASGNVDVGGDVSVNDLNLHAGDDGAGNLDVRDRRLDTDFIVLRAGDGPEGDNNSEILISDSTRFAGKSQAVPNELSLRHEKDLEPIDLAQVGPPDSETPNLSGMRYTLHSDGGSVTIKDGQAERVKDTQLTLVSERDDRGLGIDIQENIQVESIEARADGSIAVKDIQGPGSSEAATFINLHAADGLFGGDLDVRGAELRAKEIKLQAAADNRFEANSKVLVDGDTRLFGIKNPDGSEASPETFVFVQEVDVTDALDPALFGDGVAEMNYTLGSRLGKVTIANAERVKETRLLIEAGDGGVDINRKLELRSLGVRSTGDVSVGEVRVRGTDGSSASPDSGDAGDLVIVATGDLENPDADPKTITLNGDLSALTGEPLATSGGRAGEDGDVAFLGRVELAEDVDIEGRNISVLGTVDSQAGGPARALTIRDADTLQAGDTTFTDSIGDRAALSSLTVNGLSGVIVMDGPEVELDDEFGTTVDVLNVTTTGDQIYNRPLFFRGRTTLNAGDTEGGQENASVTLPFVRAGAPGSTGAPAFGNDLIVRARGDARLQNTVTAHTIDVHAGTDGVGQVVVARAASDTSDSPVSLFAVNTSLRAGDGTGGAKTATLDIEDARFGGREGNTASPSMLTLRQDADFNEDSIPEAANLLRGTEGVEYTLQSDDGKVEITKAESAAKVAGSQLALISGASNVKVGTALTVESLKVDAFAGAEFTANITANGAEGDTIDLRGGANGVDGLEIGAVELRGEAIALRAGSASGSDRTSQVEIDSGARMLNADGTQRPSGFTLQQDAAIVDGVDPVRFGPAGSPGVEGMAYTLQSDGAAVTIQNGSRVTGSELRLISKAQPDDSGEIATGVRIEDSIEVESLTAEARGIVELGDVEIRSDQVELYSGKDSGLPLVVKLDDGAKFLNRSGNDAPDGFALRQTADITDAVERSRFGPDASVEGMAYTLHSVSGSVTIQDGTRVQGSDLALISDAKSDDSEAIGVAIRDEVEVNTLLAQASDGIEIEAVNVRADEIELRAGNEQEADVRVSLAQETRFLNTAGDDAPDSFTLRQNATIDDALARSHFGNDGSVEGMAYTLHSNRGEVAIRDGSRVQNSQLRLLSGNGGVRIENGLEVQSLDVESAGDVEVYADVRAARVDLQAGNDGQGTVFVGDDESEAAVNIRSDDILLRAGNGELKNIGLPEEERARIEVADNARFHSLAGDDMAPESFAMRQDASLTDDQLPEASAFGDNGVAGMDYTLQSDLGSVTVESGDKIADSRLALDGDRGIEILSPDQAIAVRTLDLRSDTFLDGDLTVTDVETGSTFTGDRAIEIELAEGGKLTFDGSLTKLPDAASEDKNLGLTLTTEPSTADEDQNKEAQFIFRGDVNVEGGDLVLAARTRAEGDLTARDDLTLGANLELAETGDQILRSHDGDLTARGEFLKQGGDLTLAAGKEIRLGTRVFFFDGVEEEGATFRLEDGDFHTQGVLNTVGDTSVEARNATFGGKVTGGSDLTVTAISSVIDFQADVEMQDSATLSLNSPDTQGIVFSSPEAEQRIAAGNIRFNAGGRDSAPPIVTILREDGSLTIIAAEEFRMGFGEKLTAIGDLEISAEHAVLGDLNALNIVVSAALIEVLTRPAGPVRLPDGSEVMDQGVDFVANSITFSSTPVGIGAGGIITFYTPSTTEVSDALVNGSLTLRAISGQLGGVTPEMLRRAVEGGSEVLDLTGDGPPRFDGVARISNVEAAAINEPPPTLPLSQYNANAVSARPLRASQVMAFLKTGAQAEGQEFIDPALNTRPALGAREIYHELFYERIIDPVSGRSVTRPAQDRVSQALQQALDGYVFSADRGRIDGVEFTGYLASQPRFLEAFGYLHRFAELLASLDGLPLPAEEREDLNHLLLEQLELDGISDSELLTAISAVSTS